MIKKIKNSESIISDLDIYDLLKNESDRMQNSQLHQYQKLMAYYRCAIMEISTKFNVLNEEFSLQYDRNPISSIKSRLKKVSSMKEKLEKNGYPFSLESIENHLNDVAGIRVVCSFPDDVYMLADALVKQDDITVIARKDYIKNPKPNGYRSLHLIVTVPIFLAHEKRIMKVEIQLRTIAMDFWATLEHQLRYKKNIEFTDEMAKELFQCAQLSADLDARMDALKDKVQLDKNVKKIPNTLFYD
ncbi:MAG: GTP pyrophosphokinase family protein [Oscillospiraceae bacterium]|nr:GTP pyrophosphokinase family protein [Oscillospiraceae bacterium]